MNRALRTSFIAAAAAAALGLTACGGPSADPSPTVLATQVAPEGPTATTPAPAVGETEEGTAGETGGETGEGTAGETGEGTAEATTGTATPTTDPASPGAAGTTPPSTPTPAAPAPAPAASATPTSAGEATGHERELL
ncbi:MAG: hypothetical protein Q4G64_10770, partial [bacterium]|nr:hypothetical protein [bacterium]